MLHSPVTDVQICKKGLKSFRNMTIIMSMTVTVSLDFIDFTHEAEEMDDADTDEEESMVANSLYS
jgi:hypothetical protein